ncbi:hypothetical protein [Streptomyces sp. 3214.6]|uniref:hypothetical protein n=1 Tax=Streptomyces sp. 3214.6 TaxID=1882757 RepID=UPI0009A76236|nr:hypothetical protein [Streptomyces sp. 3214.6]
MTTTCAWTPGPTTSSADPRARPPPTRPARGPAQHRQALSLKEREHLRRLGQRRSTPRRLLNGITRTLLPLTVVVGVSTISTAPGALVHQWTCDAASALTTKKNQIWRLAGKD